MTHTCPPDWVPVPTLGCFRTMADFYTTLELTLATVVVVTVGLFIIRRYRVRHQRDVEGGDDD